MTTLHALSAHFAAPTVAPALAWLARTSIDAAVVAVLVIVVQATFGRWLTPGWRYRLWGLVVLRLLLPVLPASPTSLWSLRVGAPVLRLLTPAVPAIETQSIRPAPVQPAAPAAHPGLTVKVFAGPLDPAALAAPSTAAPAPPKPQPTPVPAPVPTPSRLPLLLALAWLTGTALLLSRLVVSNLAFMRRLRHACRVTDPALLTMLAECGRLMRVSRLPPVLVTDAVRGPAAAGVWRRRILLPPGLFDALSPAERRTVLLHELAHVRCADVAANWLLALLQALHWFNPVLWFAFGRLRADRELARDAMVLSIAATSEEDDGRGTAAQRYAQTLLRLTERLSARPGLPATAAAVAGVAGIVNERPSSFPLVPGLFGGRTGLQRRLRMITRLPASSRRLTFIGPALLLALGCGTLTQPTSGEPAASAAAPQKSATQPQAPGNERRVNEERELIIKARRLTDDGRYKEALAVVDQLLLLNPRNDYAVGVRPLLEDKIAPAAQRAGTAKPLAPEEAAAVQAMLDRKFPEVRFDGVGFGDVIEFLRDVGGANIFVNWKALEAAGIDRKVPVTARLYNVKFSKALQVILDSASNQAARLGYTIDEGVVTVSTADDLSKNTLTRVYDIRDLIIQPPDFDPGPGLLGLSPTTKPSDPGPEQQDRQRQGDVRKGREGRVKDILKLITDTVATDTWKDNGGSVGAVKELSGQLIVTQTPENHLQLTTLLEQLRESKGIQVTVEARFVTCDEEVVARLLKEWGKAAPATTNPATLPERSTGPNGPEGRVPAGVFLDDKQVNQLLAAAQAEKESAVVSAPRMTLFSGQRAYVLVSSEQAYVQDYAAIAKGGEIRYEPVMGVAQAGVMTDMQATVSADRRFATLTIHPKLTTLLGMNTLPWPGRPAGSNLTVQVPDMKTTELRTTVSVPNGGTVLLGGLEYPGDRPGGAAAAGPTTAPSPKPTTQPARNMILLVKPKLVLQRERRQQEFPLANPEATRPIK